MKKIKLFKKNENRSYKTTVFLTLSGYNLERYINQLSKQKIKIFSVKKNSLKDSIIEVSFFDEKRVEKFLKSKNIIVVSKKYNGFSKVINFFKFRYAILIGIFICFCFFVVASNYVLRIEVVGNERCSKEDIVKVLDDNGVKYFSPLNIKTNSEIEKIVIENFEEISMVSVVKKGSSIIINIKEKVLNDEYENLDKSQAVVAKEDGIITDIELIQGTALVKVGDVVKAGDILVAPFIIDSSGKQIPIQAKANIYANVWLNGSVTFESKKEITRRTGNHISERKMIFLNQEIVTTKVEIPYLQYELEIKEELLSDYLLPIKYITTTYFEVENVVVETDFESVKEEKIAEAKNLAKIRLKEGDNIVEENNLITEREGVFYIDYVITVLRNIAWQFAKIFKCVNM